MVNGPLKPLNLIGRLSHLHNTPFGTFIPGSLGTSFVACRDNFRRKNCKYGGPS